MALRNEQESLRGRCLLRCLSMGSYTGGEARKASRITLQLVRNRMEETNERIYGDR
jgi:hypothetical protein